MRSSGILDIEPYFFRGGDTGVLLLHGFTATPTEMQLISHYFFNNGLTVSAPLLPGHGTTPADCNRYRWQHWANYATIALAELQDQCTRVFVGGLSMGALLSLYLAAKVAGIQGILSYAPAIKVSDRRQFLAPVIKIFKRTVNKSSARTPNREIDAIRWAYDVYPTRAAHELLKLQVEVKHLLPDISAPLLIVYSTADERIKTDGIDLLMKKVGSSEKEVVKLKQSGHIITLDKEWEIVAQKSLQFIDKHR